MENLDFEQFAEFIRTHNQLRQNELIDPNTQFERDLGITGDDGSELLEAVEKRFNVNFCSEEDGLRRTFNLDHNEYLFHSEGLELFPFEMPSITGRNLTPVVRPFTVGELYDAVQRALKNSLGMA